MGWLCRICRELWRGFAGLQTSMEGWQGVWRALQGHPAGVMADLGRACEGLIISY